MDYLIRVVDKFSSELNELKCISWYDLKVEKNRIYEQMQNEKFLSIVLKDNTNILISVDSILYLEFEELINNEEINR